MAAPCENDWEDPRLAVSGFVNDYIVRRLAKEGVEWKDAPSVAAGAEREHDAMRVVCELTEGTFGEGLDDIEFSDFREVLEEIGGSDSEGGMSYGNMVNLLSCAGLVCLSHARKDNWTDIPQIVQLTAEFIDEGIRVSWKETGRSWTAPVDPAAAASAARDAVAAASAATDAAMLLGSDASRRVAELAWEEAEKTVSAAKAAFSLQASAAAPAAPAVAVAAAPVPLAAPLARAKKPAAAAAPAAVAPFAAPPSAPASRAARPKRAQSVPPAPRVRDCYGQFKSATAAPAGPGRGSGPRAKGRFVKDPRLAIDGFVTNYVVWRLAKDGFEWRAAPEVSRGAEREHEMMRTMCEWFELAPPISYPYCPDLDSFVQCKVEMDASTSLPNGAKYHDVIELIVFTGIKCVEKAKEGQEYEVAEIAQISETYIDECIRVSWSQQGLSWAGLEAFIAVQLPLYLDSISQLRDAKHAIYRYERKKSSARWTILNCTLFAIAGYSVLRKYDISIRPFAHFIGVGAFVALHVLMAENAH